VRRNGALTADSGGKAATKMSVAALARKRLKTGGVVGGAIALVTFICLLFCVVP
jgi:hypothetical protein